MKKIIFLLWITFLLPVRAKECPRWDTQEAARNINRLFGEVAYHDELYFSQNAPIISDGEYDALVARLKYWQACFPAQKIKAPPPQTHQNSYTIDHRAPMGSLKKAWSDREVKRFLQRIPGSDVLVQPKIDGVAVELVYKQGHLITASTRGNGSTGVDIVNHIRQMPLIPKTLSRQDNNEHTELVLHGELFARLDKVSTAILDSYASARHLVAGQLNRSEPDIEAIKAFDFFPWHWIDSPYTRDLQSIKALARKGFPLPLEYTHKAESYPEIKQILEHYSAIRQSIFLLDGIVIKTSSSSLRRQLGWKGDTPAWALAWKFPPETATSEVQAITFTIGRTGHITPVVHIEPVVVQNRTLSTVSLGSLQNLKKMNLAVGDQISIKLKGNAIPVFDKVLFRPENRRRPKLPDMSRYTPLSCLSISPGCDKQFIARLVWLTGIQGLDLAAISTPVIHQWVKAGTVRTLVDILQLKQASLQAVGMDQQAIQQYRESIRSPKSLERKIRALSIPGIGRHKALQLTGCITTLHGLFSRRLVDKCSGISSNRIDDLQDYVNIKEVRKLIEFLEGSVSTRSVETR